MIISKNGKKIDVQLEIVRERINGIITWSDLVEPTKSDLESMANQKCDHQNQKKLLIVDDFGDIFSSRTCFLCGKHLGYI